MPGYIAKPPSPVLQRGDLLARGLVAAFNLGEGAGQNIRDIAGTGNDGTLINGAGWAPSGFGASLSFSNFDYVDCGNRLDASTNFSSPITFGGIIYPTSSASYQHIIVRGNGAGLRQFGVALTGGDTSSVFVNVGPTFQSAIGLSSPYVVNAWNFVLITADGSHISVFLNGSRVARTNDTDLPNTVASTTYHLTLGADLGGPNSIVSGGKVAAAFVWNRALSSTEIAQLHQDPFRFYRPRSRLWEFAAPAIGPVGPDYIYFDVTL